MTPQVVAIRELIREFGALRAAFYAMDRALRAVSREKARLVMYELWAQPVAPRSVLPRGRGGSIEVRSLYVGDALLHELARPAAVIAARFAQGGHCLAAVKAGRLVGCLWLNLGPYDEDEVRCRFVPAPAGKSVWDYDVYVDPEHRGGLVFARLWDAANELLREHAFEWTMSRVSAFNTASRMAHSRLGGKIVGSALFIVLGRAQLLMTKSPLSLGVSIRDRYRPTIRVTAPAVET